MHQVHELAEAKIKQDKKFRSALGISKDYKEGGHWQKQEERQRAAMEKNGEGPAAPSDIWVRKDDILKSYNTTTYEQLFGALRSQRAGLPNGLIVGI